MDREYKKEMDALAFSEEDKMRIVGNLISEQADISPKKGSYRVMRFAAASAAVVALTAVLGGVAYASGALLSVGNAFDDLFGGAPAQTEVVDKIGKPIGASAESHGVIVTADAIIGDRSNYAVVYSISKSDGSAFEELDELKAYMADMPDPANKMLPLGFDGPALPEIDGIYGGSGGGSYFYDSDPNDNAIQFVSKTSIDTGADSIIGRIARVNLGNIMVYDGDSEPRVFAEGTWNLKFTINYEDTSVEIPAGFDADCNGMKAEVSEITISPIAITVCYTIDEVMEWEDQESGKMSDHNAAEQDRFMNLPVIITMEDGTEIDATNSAASLSENDGTSELQKSFIFDSFINLEEIESIAIGGTEVAIS